MKENGDIDKMNYTERNGNTVYVYTQTYQLGKDYLLRALDSIKKQTYQNFQCIIYDNCSDVDVREMIYEYIKEDSRFSLTYFDKTKGHAIAWEYGIPQILHMAGDEGGFFCIVDADDELEPDCFEKMVAYMRSNALDMAACGSLFVDADTMKVRGIRNIQSNVILEGALFESCFPQYYQVMRTHWAKMYRLDVIKKMNLSNCNIIPYGSDTLFVREALLMSNRVGIMPEALYRYYVYPEVRDYNVVKGRTNAPRVLLERDISFLLQKCGSISSNTIEWLINVYLQENIDVFNLVLSNRDDSRQKIEDIYFVLSSTPCRMAMRLGARGKYTYLCDWLLHQNILEDEQIFNKCCEIFGIICAVPEKIPNGGNADYFRFLIKLYDFWDDYDSKKVVEKNIISCTRNSLLLQNCDFYYCKFNADIVELLLRENYKAAYQKIKEAIQKANYFEKQFIQQNVEIGQNVAAILQDEAEFVYMNKKKVELLMEDNLPEALAEVNEWMKILPEDEDFIELKQKVTERIQTR